MNTIRITLSVAIVMLLNSCVNTEHNRNEAATPTIEIILSRQERGKMDDGSVLIAKIKNTSKIPVILDRRALILARFVEIYSGSKKSFVSKLPPRPSSFADEDRLMLPSGESFQIEFAVGDIMPYPMSELIPITLKCSYEPQIFVSFDKNIVKPEGYLDGQFFSNVVIVEN